MSLLQYFANVKVLPNSEVTKIGEKSTAKGNNRVTEVLERSSRKRKATAHSDEARVKIGKYASIHGTPSAWRHFKTELGDIPESTVRKYKHLYKKEVAARAKGDDFSDVTAIPLKK